MKNKKKLLVLIMSAMCLLSSISAFAAESERGSIQITLTDGDIGTSKKNVVFEYAKVADLVNGRYDLLEDCGDIDLNETENAEELEQAAQEISEHVAADGKVVTDNQGEAVITDLDIGVYLLRVSDKAGYENVSPVLIAIPTWDEEAGDMDYDVTVIPKHSPIIMNAGVKTGDTNTYIPYAVLILGAVTVISIILHYRKKTRSTL